jgi:hypothetical protein
MNSYNNQTPASKLLYSPSSFRNRLSIQSTERQQNYITLKRPTVRLNSPSFVWKSADSVSPQRVGLRRFGLYIPLSNGRRAKSSTPSNEDEMEGEERMFRQSWPLARIQQQQGLITVLDKTESKVIIRSSPTRTYFRQVWPAKESFGSAAVESDLQLEEDSERRYTPKRKRNLEKDEIEG